MQLLQYQFFASSLKSNLQQALRFRATAFNYLNYDELTQTSYTTDLTHTAVQ